MNQIIDFPTIYRNQPPPSGAEWIAKFNPMKTKTESGGIVLFHGNRGTGKTRMAYEIALRGKFPEMFMKRINSNEQRPIIYRTAMEIFMELRSTYLKNAGESEFDLFQWYQGAALLVIDEMQERGETAFEDQKLTALVDGRYRVGRPTILIANFTKEQFSNSVSPSILSRIVECGGAVDFSWKSYRQPK